MPDKGARLNLILSPQANKLLEDMAAQNHCSKSEIFRKAFALYEIAMKATQEGKKIALLNSERQVLVELVGI
jgi:hypothetical protein